MEIVDRFFGLKRRRQKGVLDSLGIEGKLEKEYAGPDLEEASVVKIGNGKFQEILRSRNYNQVLVHLFTQSDTPQACDFYIGIHKDIFIKTPVVSLDDGGQRTLFSDLDEMSFEHIKEESGQGWLVYKRGRVLKRFEHQDF